MEPYDKERSLSSIASKYLDMPFNPGEKSPGKIDCLGLVHAVITDMGKIIPREYGKYSIDRPQEYQALMEQSPEEAYKTLLEMAASIGEEIKPAYKKAGDLLIVGLAETPFAAVYVGNGHAISCFIDKGVQVVPVINKTILMVRRFQ